MGHGGARPRSGPAPDPNALRRDRKDDAAGWTILPGPRTDPAPEWPLPTPPSPHEAEQWLTVWSTPQAHQWAANGIETEVALYIRTLIEAEAPGSATNLRTLAKQMQENLGLSYVGLLKFRWRIADSAPPAATATSEKSPAARPARGRKSSRDRLTVVPVPTTDD